MAIAALLVAGLLGQPSGGAAPAGFSADSQSAGEVDFARDIAPILESRCYECHGPKKSRGRLRLDQKVSALKGGMTGPAVVPGDSETSVLVRRLLGLDGEDRMPLDEDSLPAEQIALFQQWIDSGAPWPDTGEARLAEADQGPTHWAYRAPERPPFPEVAREGWVRTPIDRFVMARLEKEGLAPAEEASKEALLRRVSLDLIGLPPTLDELDAFLADSREDAYERQVDRLLASPHYGERWARPWLDLARYADSNGYEKDRLRTMWKYRDWVIDALNRDMPFDQFTIEQIAGDMLPDATIDQLVASGFHRNTLLNQEGGIDVEEARWEALLDRVNTTGTVWLGTTIACAQCHNHKYDPFSQQDYYRMLAFFDNGEYTVGGLAGGDRWIEEPVLDLPTPDQAERRDALISEREELTRRLAAPSPEIDAGQSDWERAIRNTGDDWTVLVPSSARADAATLVTQPDGSILASGDHAGTDEYMIMGALAPGRLTGVRLEALPDVSLPQGGPGRDHYGNFVLTRFTLELIGDGGTRTVTFASAASDDSSGGDVTLLLDPAAASYRGRDLPAGWSIDATRDISRLPRQAVFVPEPGTSIGPETTARVTLTFQGGNVGQALGRLRLSTTNADDPKKAVSLRAKTRALLDIAPEQRTEQQRETLRSAYRNQVVALEPLRERLEVIEEELDHLGIVTALVMREKQSYERPSTPFRDRGAFLSPGPLVYADTPEVLPPLPEDQMPNRLGLARWLVDDDNPLTARVMVNRAWEQIFGRGLVETSEDFGTQGESPSHPDLLDWLATEFVTSNWSQKALHRLIVTSATYRQSASTTAALLEQDPYNRLLARGPRFRLAAETIRDVTLAASGLLSLKMGGPSVFPPQPDGIWDNPYSSEKWIESEGEDRYRRGLYTFVRRTSPYPGFITFDATSREFCTVRRVRTNTPLQALAGLNDEAAFEAAQALARRMMKDVAVTASTAHADAAATKAAYGFRLCTSRKPSDEEVDRVVDSYRVQLERFKGDASAAAQVVGSSVESADAELAAWTLVANALLNLDETLTK
jgi:hypothetical protein